MHWELGVLATGPPEKSHISHFKCSVITCDCVHAQLLQSCLTLYDPMEPSRLLCPWDFPGNNNGVGCHFLLQGIFLTQGSKPCLLRLLYCRQILYHRATREAHHTWLSSVQFSSAAQSCPTLCNPMNRSTPGLPVHHQLQEFTQTHVHRVSDAIQPSYPLSSPSLPAPNPSQHHSLFQ